MTTTNNFSLKSTIHAPQGKKPYVELAFVEEPIPKPNSNQVVIRVEACPVNPSDVHIITTEVADLKNSVSGTDKAGNPTFRCEFPKEHIPNVRVRLGKPLTPGLEGAGVVVAAGSSAEAQKLLGKTVAIFAGGGTYAHYLVVSASQCLELLPGTSAKEGASSFVNPLTVLGMVETMKDHKAKGIIHTAAASQLGQMLVKVCQADNITLINIVRRDEQADILKKLGAKYILNTSKSNWTEELAELIYKTGIYLAFDATGGGHLASQILSAMEQAGSRDLTTYSRYGSDIYKVVYVYGFLDTSPIVLNKTYGLVWAVKGWLLAKYLNSIGEARNKAMRERVAKEIKTNFATQYTKEISLKDLTNKEILLKISKQTTGEKYLLLPQKGNQAKRSKL